MLDVVVDLSHNNGAVDWRAVAAAGIKFAWLKASEGLHVVDHRYAENVAGAAAAGLMVGSYDFLRPGHGAAEAAFFARTAGLAAGSVAALDWEGRASDTCSPAEAEAAGVAVGVVVKRHVVWYYGRPGSTPARPTSAMNAGDRWVPRYPQLPQPADFARMAPAHRAMVPGGALFWQYTSAGRVSGIAGDVDRSVWCGTLDELITWYKTGARPRLP